MGLCQIEKDRTYSLFEFREVQFTQLSDVSVFLATEIRGMYWMSCLVHHTGISSYE